jgi:hypothetical protein
VRLVNAQKKHGPRGTELKGESGKTNNKARPAVLTVLSTAQAQITISEISGRAPNKITVVQQRTIPADAAPLRLELKPGRHLIRAELPGYEPRQEEIVLNQGKNDLLSLQLQPRTYQLRLKLNAASGEIRYGTPGEPAAGRRRFQQHRAVLPPLRAGRYAIEVLPDELIWQPFARELEAGPGLSLDHDFNLEPRRCEIPINEVWKSLADWEAPAGWRTGSEKLHPNGPGLALPRAAHYWCYADFELTSDVKLGNDHSVAFVLRAQDRQNYYLIELTGRLADEPYTLRGFPVRNGVPQPRLAGTNTIAAFAASLTGRFFEVQIKATGHQFKVLMQDSQTGQVEPLGVLTDPERRFAIGAVGLAVQGAAQNEIGRFMVQPVKPGAR